MKEVKIIFFNKSPYISVYIMYNKQITVSFRNYSLKESDFEILRKDINQVLSNYKLKFEIPLNYLKQVNEVIIFDIKKNILFYDQTVIIYGKKHPCKIQQLNTVLEVVNTAQFLFENKNYYHSLLLFYEIYPKTRIYKNNAEKFISFFKESLINNENIDIAVSIYTESVNFNYTELFDRLSNFLSDLENQKESDNEIPININTISQYMKKNNIFTLTTLELNKKYIKGLDLFYIKLAIFLFQNNISPKRIIENILKRVLNTNELYKEAFSMNDYETARIIMNIAAYKGNLDAFYFIKNNFHNQYFIEQCFKKRFDLFEFLFEHPTKKNTFFDNFFSKEVVSFSKTLLKGYYFFDTSNYYLNKNLITPNFKKAMFYLKKAVENNYTPALIKAGIYFMNGLYLKQNSKKAFYYFKKALKLNNHDSLYYLGYCYENGIGVTKNIKKAIKYYEKGEKYNCEKSIIRLKEIINEADYKKIINITNLSDRLWDFVNKDIYTLQYSIQYKNIFKFCKILLKLGKKTAYSKIGQCYEKGIGVQIDLNKAIKYYQKAITENNDLSAMIFLGKIYYNQKNYDEAIKLLKNKQNYNDLEVINILLDYYKNINKDAEEYRYFYHIKEKLEGRDSLIWDEMDKRNYSYRIK